MALLIRLCTAAVLLIPWMAGCSHAQPVATINGQSISESELASSVEGQLRQLRRQEYEAKRSALEDLINKRLVESEAQARGTTSERLLAEVDAKAGPPTDGEVEAFYLAQRDRINRPLESVKPQIRKTLQQMKLQQVREDFYLGLREKGKVAILLRPPKVAVSIDPARVRGDARAPVTIVEFSDFQCPFCQRVQPTLQEILAKYPGKVNLAYRDFPLVQIHPNAHRAAEASRCAGEQGKFWEYHDVLYVNITKLAEDDLAEHAKSVGLDGLKFAMCLSSGRYRASVDEDMRAGANTGVTGTPAFIVNGVVLEGAQPMSAFQEVIDAELAAPKSSPRN